MKTFPKPKNLNGTELIDELAAKNIIVDNIYDFSDGTIGFITDDENLAATVVAKHNGNQIPKEPTVAEKLASVGLGVDELKAALGL